MVTNEVTFPIGVFLFSIVTAALSLFILGYVLRIQLSQFKVKTELQPTKYALLGTVLGLMIANLITLTIALIYIGRPIPSSVVAVTSIANRFSTIAAIACLGLVYKFQIHTK